MYDAIPYQECLVGGVVTLSPAGSQKIFGILCRTKTTYELPKKRNGKKNQNNGLGYVFGACMQELKTKVDSLLKAGKLFVVDHELLKVRAVEFLPCRTGFSLTPVYNTSGLWTLVPWLYGAVSVGFVFA